MRLLLFLVIFLVQGVEAQERFPKADAELVAAFSRYAQKPHHQAMLSYLYQFGTGKRIDPPTPQAREKLEFTRMVFESDWKTLKWSSLRVQDFYQMSAASIAFREPFMAAFPGRYPVFPGDVYKLFARRAQMGAGQRAILSSEAAFWLALVPCLDAGGEFFADGFSANMAHNFRVWMASLSEAERRMRSEEKLPGGLCGDGARTFGQSAPNQLLTLLKLNPVRERAFYLKAHQELERSLLKGRKDLGAQFEKDLLDLETELKSRF